MSLILDALKQADSERARGSVPGVFSQPLQSTGEPAPSARWGLLVWLLLAAAAGAALLWFAGPDLLREAGPGKATPSQVPATVAQPAPVAVPASTAMFHAAPVVSAQPAEPAPLPAVAERALPSGLEAPAMPATQASTPPVPSAAELPASVRSGLPSVLITGHTYSDNPTLRMLMIDGHMVVEGQAISPGLRLERIGPHQAVFNHRGTRFSVDY